MPNASDHPPDAPDAIVTDADRAAAEAVVVSGGVSRWAIHRRLYDWVLSFAHHKHATTALAAMAFAESSFFPLPPDVLLGPLCLGKPRRAWWFAAITTISSVLGALLGYYIGFALWDLTRDFWFRWIPGLTPENFEIVRGWYDRHGVKVLFIAAFTPLPFKVFTITGGILAQPLGPFVLVSLVGRGMRFFLVAAVFYWVGPKAVPFIDRYFNLLCVVFVLLLIGGFMLVKWLH